jgi:flagellar basal body rod protein FlgB
MGGIRKVSHTQRRQDFRSRLQRALSLSSSESEKARSPSASEPGDTTEDEVLQDRNDRSADQDNSNSAEESEEAPRERRKKSKYERDLERSKQTQLPEDGNTVALECVAE